MTTYRLSHTRSAAVAPPTLDRFQQSVVDHPGGPLLVLAGPGTGKTTTLVEAIVDRIERRGASPESVLALTFSRKAAEQLRDRVTARLGRTMATTLSSTFHSFAYGLVRRYSSADLYAAPLRLLSAPEQDVILQELLAGNRDTALWPSSLDQAVATRGFAREVQEVLSRAREKGLDPLDLKELGDAADAPELAAAALFMQQYQVILDDQSLIDYPELIYRAVLLSEQPAVRADLRARFSHVFVDEYQDTDPSQVRLLRALAGDGRDLTVVGDPDQSIYAFRGAEVRGILDFPRAFPHTDGTPAGTVALRVTRRFGPRLLRLSRAVVSGLATTGSIDAETFAAFRHPDAQAGPFGSGRADVLTFDTDRAETEHVADLLRRAHLEDGLPWSEMAVLVRSGRGTIPRLRRALGAAGVPVEVASDDTPLVAEPAVMPLLDALRAVVDLAVADPADADHFGPDRAESLLASPVAGLDATEVRALARALRAREKRALVERSPAPAPETAPGTDPGGTDPGGTDPGGETDPAGETTAPRGPRSSPELLRDALLDPAMLEGIRERGAAKALALGRLLAGGRALLDDGATAEEVLWLLWSGTDWPRRLRRGVDLGGQAARLAHRDLDAICALFETAARAEEQRGHTSVVNFVESLRAQQIPADTLAEQGVRGDAVRLLTAHRSKGLEWRFVVVAHVQDEGWPDLRRRSTLLHADRIGADGPAAAADRAGPARRGAAAVLRRLHPRPGAAAGHRGQVARRRRRAAVPVRRRAGHGRAGGRRRGLRPAQPPAGPPAATAVPDRPGRRPAAHAVRARHLPGAAAGRRRAARGARPGPPPWSAAGALGGPRPVVGDPRPQRLRDPRRAHRRAGHAVGELAGRDPGLPGQVVPGAQGGRRDPLQPVPGLRARGAHARGPDRQGRARARAVGPAPSCSRS